MSSSHMSEEMREVEEELEHDSSRHDTQNPRGTAIPLEDVEEGMGASLSSTAESSIGGPAARARPASPRPGGGRSTSPKIALSFPLSGAARPKKDVVSEGKEGIRNAIQLLTNPVFAQAFVLTFLGEWGDRSQITTIAMGGAHVSGTYTLDLHIFGKFAAERILINQSIPVIAFGTILGHGVCTAGAVMGGRWLSTKISVKHSEPRPIHMYQNHQLTRSVSLIGAAAFVIFALLYAVEAYSTPWDARPGDDMKW